MYGRPPEHHEVMGALIRVIGRAWRGQVSMCFTVSRSPHWQSAGVYDLGMR